ncbi:MAG: SipW-dependent-type signal peptide-containing protein [Aeromicrobium sp.]
MSDHRAPQETLKRRVPLRALLSLGIVLGLGATGTLAYFTDEATMTTGAFTSGKLDLTLDQAGAGSTTIGQGGTFVKTALGITAMIPGESVAADVSVKNNAGVAFTYKASAKLDAGSTFPTSSPKLTFAVYPGTASNTGTQGAGNRAGACTGTALFAAAGLTTTAQDVISTARSLATDASESICVRVALASDADNTYQDRTATATFVFRAAQLGQTP